MSMQSVYKILEQSPSSIFFEAPAAIEVNEEARTDYAGSQTIEALIEELTRKGPFVALGNIGPGCYKEGLFKLQNPFCGKEIYGWKAGSAREKTENQNSFFVLGAKKVGDATHVYFILSQDVTPNSSSLIRTHKPSLKDRNVYVVSHETFRNYLFDAYPCTSFSTTPEQRYVDELLKLPLDTILDNGKVEAQCKAIGQRAFDEFKEKASGNSLAGKEAVQRICEKLKTAKDGHLRSQYVSHAWDGIGDAEWNWRA